MFTSFVIRKATQKDTDSFSFKTRMILSLPTKEPMGARSTVVGSLLTIKEVFILLIQGDQPSGGGQDDLEAALVTED